MEILTESRATELLSNLRGKTIAVLGDLMLDEFIWGDVTRISPEAPVPVVDIRRESIRLGGAANVLANTIALGAKAMVVGVVGDDTGGRRLKQELEEVGASLVEDTLVVDESRPSTVKTRIIAHNQLVVRADREKRQPVNPAIEDNLIKVLTRVLKRSDAFIVSDYDKGTVTKRVLSEILPLARKQQIPVIVDPKIRNFDSYKPATLITPNHHEALRLSNLEDDGDEGIVEAAGIILDRLECDSVLVTRGERGMLLLPRDGRPTHVGTVAREVYDVTGAGDTVVATLSGALSAGATLLEAAVLANHAAGIVVSKLGTATANSEELIKSLNSSR
jgi:D-glycero-beta-D-manno-heptose-7-phosphate kinase